MTRLTRDAWEHLSDKERWDVKVALRGPDCGNSEVVKWFSTAIIRYHVGEVMRVGGTVNPHLNFIIAPELYPSLITEREKKLFKEMGVKELFFNFNHFFEHIRLAAMILHIPMYWVPVNIFREAMADTGYNNIKHAIKLYADVLDPVPAADLRQYAKYHGGEEWTCPE